MMSISILFSTVDRFCYVSENLDEADLGRDYWIDLKLLCSVCDLWTFISYPPHPPPHPSLVVNRLPSLLQLFWVNLVCPSFQISGISVESTKREVQSVGDVFRRG